MKGFVVRATPTGAYAKHERPTGCDWAYYLAEAHVFETADEAAAWIIAWRSEPYRCDAEIVPIGEVADG